MNNHEKYMQRCLHLASNGLGNTYPNPLVGSVIVYNDKIIGEGYHTKAGTNHAEINAINNVKDKSLLKKSTLYVNLEPCSHYGKTPPCSKKIADIGIPNVIIGTIDTTDKVSGKGIKIMKQAGVNVIIGVLEQECKQINKRFFTFHEKQRPYVILKWAQTADGFIDKKRDNKSVKEPTWITGEHEKTLVHKWRSHEQAIMIGKNTAYFDNPELTTRNWHGENPLRIVVDNKLQLVKNLKIFNNTVNTVVFNCVEDKIHSETLKFIKISSKKSLVEQVFSYLYNQNIQSLIVEGGQILLQSFITENLWDEAKIFVGNHFFNDGIKSPKLENSELLNKQTFDKSILLSFINNTAE